MKVEFVLQDTVSKARTQTLALRGKASSQPIIGRSGMRTHELFSNC
jgi:hypothetical protein